MSNISCLKFVGLSPFAAVPRKFKCTYTSIIIISQNIIIKNNNLLPKKMKSVESKIKTYF